LRQSGGIWFNTNSGEILLLHML